MVWITVQGFKLSKLGLLVCILNPSECDPKTAFLQFVDGVQANDDAPPIETREDSTALHSTLYPSKLDRIPSGHDFEYYSSRYKLGY